MAAKLGKRVSVGLWAPVLLSVIIYLNTLRAGFVYDDLKAILQNEDVNSESSLSHLFLNDFWGVPLRHKGSHKSYRPLTTLTYRLNHLLLGFNAKFFHWTNVVLYGLCTYLFSVLSLKVTESKELGLWAGMLFAVHPIHTEAVAGLVGRAEILSGIFFLLSIINYLQEVETCLDEKNSNIVLNKGGPPSLPWTTMVYTLLSVLSKEIGITSLGVCFIIEVLRTKTSFKRISALIAGGASLLFLRGWIMGFRAPSFSEADNPASSTSVDSLTKALTFSYLPFLNFYLLLCPNSLSFDWSMDSVPLLKNLWDSRVCLSVLFYTIFTIFILKAAFHRNRRYRFALLLSLSLMVLPFTPASNLLFYVGFVIAERVLFIPSMGFCLLMALLIQEAPKRLSHKYNLSRPILGFIVLIGALKTIRRNEDWTNEEHLYKSGIAVNPPKAYGNLANILSQNDRTYEAESAFKMALHYRSNMADVHYNLGVLYQNTQRFSEAIPCYQRAMHYRPKLAQAYLNLGLIYSETGKRNKALELWKSAIQINDDNLKDPEMNLIAKISAYQNIGKILFEGGQTGPALKMLSRGLQLSPKRYPRQGLYNLLGEVYRALNQSEDAESMFLQAIRIKPDHIPAHLTYGKLLAKNKTRLKEAEAQFLLASKIAPSESSVALHYGLFLLDEDRSLEAGLQFQKAASLSPLDFESTFNAAVAFRQAGKYSLAEGFYRQSVKIKPQDASAHMNLGAMLHFIEKYQEAETHYLKARSLDPTNQSTRINLQRLHNIMKQKGIDPKVSVI